MSDRIQEELEALGESIDYRMSQLNDCQKQLAELTAQRDALTLTISRFREPTHELMRAAYRWASNRKPADETERRLLQAVEALDAAMRDHPETFYDGAGKK